MFQYCVIAAAVVAGVCGPVRAETFLATITKVDGDKVTYMRATYHADKVGADKYTHDDPVTTVVVKDVAVTRGHFLPVVAGDTATDGRLTGKTTPLKDGLDDKLVKNLNAGKSTRPSLITVAEKGDDKGKITAINFWSSGSLK